MAIGLPELPYAKGALAPIRKNHQGQVYRACCPKLFEIKIVQCDTD